MTVQMTAEEAVWWLLRNLDTPVVGEAIQNEPNAGQVLDKLFRPPAFNMLSSGEQIVVQIAFGIYTGNDKLGPGIPALGKLDRNLRRKVWAIVGSVYGLEPHA